MTRTNKKIQTKKLIDNNNVIIHQDKTVLNINDVINELKIEYEILEYTIEYNNFFDNMLYTLKIIFNANSKDTLMFITVFINDTVNIITNKIKINLIHGIIYNVIYAIMNL